LVLEYVFKLKIVICCCLNIYMISHVWFIIFCLYVIGGLVVVSFFLSLTSKYLLLILDWFISMFFGGVSVF
jgi:hypothetical protein